MNFDFESFFHLIKKCIFFAVRKLDLIQLKRYFLSNRRKK